MKQAFEIGPAELALLEAISALNMTMTQIRHTLRIMGALDCEAGKEELQQQHRHLADTLANLYKVRAQMEEQRDW